MYCGDETGSFIGDVGSHTSRFGYGGEDNPKYVVPSYMSSLTENAEEKHFIPTSCYQGRLASQSVQPVMRMPWLSDDTDDDTVKRLAAATPQVNPNAYLQQGDIIQDWDALETLWQTSFDILRARDTLKHTKGGTPFRSSSSPENSSSSSSSNINTTATESARCIHPILAVTPGLTHIMGSGSGQGTKYAAAVEREQQSRLTEFLMETMEAPAMFLAPTPMLSSFCFGRQTSLVVDIGAGGCRVTPVVDGLVLKHAQRRNGRGGDWLGNVQWRAMSEDKIVLRPRYQLRNNVSAMNTKSPYLYRWAMQDLMYEMRSSSHTSLPVWCVDETVPFMSSKTCSTDSASTSGSKSSADEENNDNDDVDDDNSKSANASNGEQKEQDEEDSGSDQAEDTMDLDDNEKSATPSTLIRGGGGRGGGESIPGNTYELPDGTCVDMSTNTGKDLCRIPELLFTDAVPFVTECSGPAGILREHHTLANLPLHQLIFESLSAVGDGDIRKDLASNILLTGGSSMFPNLEQRLSMEVPRIVPSAYKCRGVTSRNAVERTCSAWVGGSVLTSLGSFQQLWLSRAEYEEYGTALSVQRFP